MKNGLHILVKDKKAGAEAVVKSLLDNIEISKNYDFKVFIISKFWANQSNLFPQNTVNLWTVVISNWSIIHSHLFWGGLFQGMILKKIHQRTLWVHTLHYASYYGQRWARLRAFLDKYFVFSRADNLHIVSKSCLAIVSDLLDPVLIENSVPSFADRISLLKINESLVTKNKKFLTDKSLTILSVGSFRKEKGVERIIETAFHLVKKNIKFKWILCGDGILLENFKKKVIQNNLQNNIQCVGFQEKLENFYLEADIFVNTSHTESFGLAINDALKLNLPVFTSNVDHMSTLLGDGKLGSLIPSDKFFSTNLAHEINLFYRNKPLLPIQSSSLIKAGIERQSPPKTKNTEQWLKLYDSKVLLFISPITTHATGGIQKQLYLQTCELAKCGFKIYILQRHDSCLYTDTELQSKWSHVNFKQCFYFSSLDKSYIGQRINGLLFILHGFFHLLRFKRIDATHALQMYSPTLIGIIAKILFKSKLIVKVTASGEYGEVNQLKVLPFIGIRKYLFKFVDRFLSLTSSMKDELIEFGIKPAQISVVPNSVEIFDRVGADTINQFNILYVGRISTEKSLETLLEATISLANFFPDKKINLELVGRIYPDRNNYEELVQISKLGKKSNLSIHFLGHKNDTASEYKKAHVFVLPSVSEGMSNALLEALSYGIPCLVSDIPANTDLVTENMNGLVFKLKNSEHLFKQLSRLIIDCFENDFVLSRRLSQSAKNLIQTKFSVESVCQEIIKNYDLK